MSLTLSALISRLHGIAIHVGFVGRVLRLVWSAARRLTFVWAVLLVIQGLLPVVVISLTGWLVDSLTGAVGTHNVSWEHVESVLILGIGLGAALLFSELIGGLIDWVRTAQSEQVQDHISALIHTQSVAVDLGYYESAEYHDRLDQARGEAGGRSLALLESVGSVAQNSITLLSMAAVLLPYGAWLPLLLIISTLPALYIVARFNRVYHRWWEQTTPDRRRTQYYDTMLTYSGAAAEVRLFGLGEHFQTAFQAIRRRLRGERLALLRSQSLARLGASVVAFLAAGGAMAWMGWRLLNGQITLGELTLFYQAFNRGQGLMRSLLGNIAQIYSNSLFLSNLFEFLSLRPNVAEPHQPRVMPTMLKQGIRFRNVTFSYPGSNRPALENFNLTLPQNQIVAIVGENGAGKSTLIKLLCRFYDPQEGSVEIDGIDIRSFALADLWRALTVMFQFPVYFHASARENIAMGDLAGHPDAAAVEKAARSAGAHDVIAHLPADYDTLLGRWFADGVELSGGEWQRIALARAFLRRAPIMVLDEPTSFMDSWFEADWFERFRALADGRTSVVVTHRFTIAMRADIIHVMDAGRIVESGTHHELLALGGLYAQSWDAQMRASAAGPVEEYANA